MKKFLLMISMIFILSNFSIPVYASDMDFTFNVGNDTSIEIDKNNGNSSQDLSKVSRTDNWNQLMIKYGNMIIAIGGFAMIICLGLLIYSFTNLGASAENPQRRKDALIGIGFSFAGIALLASAGLWYNITYGFFR